MSILNDRRRYGTDEERAEWMSELRREFEEHQPDYPDEPTHYCEECEFCKEGKRFVMDIESNAWGSEVCLKQTNRYTFMDICVRDMEHIREIHRYDEVCKDHGELFERED